MSKKYILQIEIDESSDDFWRDINFRKVTGCDEVIEEIASCLEDHGFIKDRNCNITLIGYENK